MLFRTRAGLILRAVGDNHTSAHALGYRVIGVRYLAILFGGACAGLGGAYLSLVYTPLWVENMTAGRGWIALALVVFASWIPYRVAIGAYLFGAVTHPAAARAAARPRRPVAVPVDAALSCHGRWFWSSSPATGALIRREYAGLPRAAFRAGPLSGRLRQGWAARSVASALLRPHRTRFEDEREER